MLIGIVKNNAIMMRLCAAAGARRRQGTGGLDLRSGGAALPSDQMTTMAALFGTLPIAIGIGAGSDMRQLLGLAVVGGLIVSQALTLFTTPVTYLYMASALLRPGASGADARRLRRHPPHPNPMAGRPESDHARATSSKWNMLALENSISLRKAGEFEVLPLWCGDLCG
jgi:hydrophobic/amphiphilic exporter-1 (mainly G- bacteria), HAE1 family